MQKSNPTAFPEKELDQLLNQSFLESHLANSKNEKMVGAISAQVFGLNAISNSTPDSFIKKLTRKISLQVFLIGSFAILCGVTGFILTKTNPEEPKKIAMPITTTPEQPVITSTKKTEERQNILPQKNTSSTLHYNIQEESSENYNTAPAIAYEDSSADNLATKLPEPIYFNDPAIVLPKKNNSTSMNSKRNEKNNSNEQPKRKRRAKAERRREHEVRFDADHFN